MAITKSVRVLVIDDELTHRMLVKEYLEEDGHEVILSEDGKRGLKLATSSKPDIILLDYLLPLVDGENICRTLKSNPATADIPVILVTASREADVIEKGLEAGAEDFITKPVDWAYLADRVVHVVRKASEKIELTRRLATQADASPVEMSEAVEAEHAAAMQKLVEQLRCEAEAERQALTLEYDGRLENLQREISQAAEAAAHESWSAKVAETEELTAMAVATVERRLRSQFAEDVAALQASHTLDLERLRDRAQLDAEMARAAAQSEKLKADRAHAEEIQVLRAEIEALSGKASVDQGGAATAFADGQARLQAAWSLVARCAAVQSNLAASVASKMSVAAADSGNPDLREAQRLALTLKRLASGFKILARTQAGCDECQEVPICLAELVGDLSAQARQAVVGRRINLHTSAVDPSLTVRADPNRLRIALMCLVSNAIRFTPAGGSIEISVLQDDGAIRISVMDNGLGIAPSKLHDLRHCLDTPAASAASGNAESAGLGIPMVHTLVRRWAGRLDLDSRVGGGTRADIILPMARHAQSSPRSAA